jgi:hypothetical protein
VNLLGRDGKVIVEQVEQLLLHQVDLGLREEMGVAALHADNLVSASCVATWRRVKDGRGRTQCLFFGELSLRYFAAQMRVARKTRWRVQGMPLVPTLGSRSRSRWR